MLRLPWVHRIVNVEVLRVFSKRGTEIEWDLKEEKLKCCRSRDGEDQSAAQRDACNNKQRVSICLPHCFVCYRLYTVGTDNVNWFFNYYRNSFR